MIFFYKDISNKNLDSSLDYINIKNLKEFEYYLYQPSNYIINSIL
jgi:hypothetical protein